jgi:hypothetical protein
LNTCKHADWEKFGMIGHRWCLDCGAIVQVAFGLQPGTEDWKHPKNATKEKTMTDESDTTATKLVEHFIALNPHCAGNEGALEKLVKEAREASEGESYAFQEGAEEWKARALAAEKTPSWPNFVTPPTKDETIRRLCTLLHEAWCAYDPSGIHPSDCFCGHGGMKHAKPENWRSSGQALVWVEQLVRQALTKPGSLGPPAEEEAEERSWQRMGATRMPIPRPPLTHVACKDRDGRIWSLPCPFRHHHVLKVMHDHGARCAEDNHYSQGFLDQDGRYLHRKAAFVNADLNKQIKNGKIIGGVLTSEDLW